MKDWWTASLAPGISWVGGTLGFASRSISSALQHWTSRSSLAIDKSDCGRRNSSDGARR
jgi:hypothetical protein